MVSCDPPAGSVRLGGDCDDDDPDRYPGSAETCDEIDNDCDLLIDEDASDARDFYFDDDGDGFGGELARRACEGVSVHVETTGDCDDHDPDRYPGNTERCDDIDNDCDGVADEDHPDAQPWYLDGDGDGYGTGAAVQACRRPSDHASQGGDCDDTDPANAPDFDEVCDGADNDCDALVDAEDSDLVSTEWYVDQDGDGYGGEPAGVLTCEEALKGHADQGGDCDDTDPAVAPDQEEVCDGADNDCDGSIDQDAADAARWYTDADGDGDGDPDSWVEACAQPSGTSASGSDCDDTDPLIGGSDEVCNCRDGADNDSDGLIDCEDGDCALDATCYESDCADWSDNDRDGLTDCFDDECWADTTCLSGPAGMGQVLSGNIRGREERNHATFSEYWGEYVVGSVKTTTATATASNIRGTAWLVSAAASSTAWCSWSVDQATWNHYRRRGEAFDSWHTEWDTTVFTAQSVARSGFRLSSGCPISISSAPLLPARLDINPEGFKMTYTFGNMWQYFCIGWQNWYAPDSILTSTSTGSTITSTPKSYWPPSYRRNTWSKQYFSGTFESGELFYRYGMCD